MSGTIYITCDKDFSGCPLYNSVYKHWKSKNPNSTDSGGQYGCGDLFNFKTLEGNNKYVRFYDLSHKTKPLPPKSNGLIRLTEGDYEDPQESNGFNLIIPKNISKEDFIALMNKRNKRFDGDTNLHIIEKINILVELFEQQGNSIPRYLEFNKERDYPYIDDLIRLDYKMLRDIRSKYRNKKIQFIHEYMFRGFGPDMFSPLLSTSMLDDINSSIKSIYAMARDMNYSKHAHAALEKYKTTISSQLDNISKLQEQVKSLNAKIDAQSKEITLQADTITNKSEEIKTLETKNEALRSKNDRLRKQAYDAENKATEIESKYGESVKNYEKLEQQVASFQKNPTEFQTRLNETSCPDCLKNAEKISHLESSIEELRSKIIPNDSGSDSDSDIECSINSDEESIDFDKL
jgi:predicted  nucleic acid-binding Zn-ribbon protein